MLKIVHLHKQMQRESEIYNEKMSGKPISEGGSRYVSEGDSRYVSEDGGKSVSEEGGRSVSEGDISSVSGEGGKPVPGGGADRRRRLPRIRLPFDDSRREDIGVWVYNHRIGLTVTLCALIITGIVFSAGHIAVGERRTNSVILIDLEDLAELNEERERLQEEIERRLRERTDWQSVRNVASNENALNENLRDDRGTKTSQLNESAAEVDQRMQANREAYERGLAEADAIGRRKNDAEKNNDQNSSSKVAGMVTVSYSFANPVRSHRYLDKPAYKCEGGGEVVVNATVDRSGKVIAAKVISGGDACMRETALQSARASTFNIDNSAPAQQTGTITYIFIPQ